MEFLHIWHVLRKRKLILIGAFFVVFLSVVICSHILTPVYETTAKLVVIESTTLTSLLSDAGIKNPARASGSNDKFDTEIGLTQIKPLLIKVIQDLQLKDRKGKLIEAEDLVDRSKILNKFMPAPYIRTEQYKESAIINIISQSKDPIEATYMSNMLANLYINSIIERTRDDYTLAKLFLTNQVKQKEAEYYAALSASRDFLLGAKIADLSLEKQKLMDKISTLQNSVEGNENEIQQIQKTLSETEKKLATMDQYRKETKSYSLNEEVKNLKAKINNLLVSVASKKLKIREAHPDFKELLNELEAAKKILDSEAKLILSSEQFAVDPRFDEYSKSLASNYINLKVAFIKREFFNKYLTQYEEKLNKIPQLEAEKSRLDAILAVKKELYSNLVAKMDRLEMAEAISLSNIKIVEPAVVPKKPDFPKKKLLYVAGFIFGWIWAVVIAFFVEYMDNTIQTPSDLKKASKLKFLGELPKTEYLQNFKLISDLPPSAQMIEPFRSIRNNIGYLTSSKNEKLSSIMVTSCVAGEGKSSVVSNLAIAFSMEGKRVLLVDLNFRSPVLSRIFGPTMLKNGEEQKTESPSMTDHGEREGFSTVIDDDSRLEPLMVNPLKNLYLIASGPVPENPAQLIESQKTKTIIEGFKKQFDMVILDTPAIFSANDAMVIGHLVDGILLVVEAGRITSAMIDDASERLKLSGLTVVGTVLNKCTSYSADYIPYNELIAGKFISMPPVKKFIDWFKRLYSKRVKPASTGR